MLLCLSSFQVWKNIHMYGSSANWGPRILTHTGWCSSRKSMWLSRSRNRCSMRFRQTDQFSVGLARFSASNQTDPKMSRVSGQSSKTSSIKSMAFDCRNPGQRSKKLSFYPRCLTADLVLNSSAEKSVSTAKCLVRPSVSLHPHLNSLYGLDYSNKLCNCANAMPH